jgi:hypothetical protein
MTSLNTRIRSTLVASALLTLAPIAHADGTVTVTRDVLHPIKGFGLFPAPYDRQMPTYSDGSPAWGDATWLGQGTTRRAIHDLVIATGADSPGTPTRPPGTSDPSPPPRAPTTCSRGRGPRSIPAGE